VGIDRSMSRISEADLRRRTMVLAGLPRAWPIGCPWRACYLSQLQNFGRKLRIMVEWSWGMLCPAGITHQRFTRSAEQPEAASSCPLVEAWRRRLDDTPQPTKHAGVGETMRMSSKAPASAGTHD